jgi:hypothetical protein
MVFRLSSLLVCEQAGDVDLRMLVVDESSKVPADSVAHPAGDASPAS